MDFPQSPSMPACLPNPDLYRAGFPVDQRTLQLQPSYNATPSFRPYLLTAENRRYVPQQFEAEGNRQRFQQNKYQSSNNIANLENGYPQEQYYNQSFPDDKRLIQRQIQSMEGFDYSCFAAPAGVGDQMFPPSRFGIGRPPARISSPPVPLSICTAPRLSTGYGMMNCPTQQPSFQPMMMHNSVQSSFVRHPITGLPQDSASYSQLHQFGIPNQTLSNSGLWQANHFAPSILHGFADELHLEPKIAKSTPVPNEFDMAAATAPHGQNGKSPEEKYKQHVDVQLPPTTCQDSMVHSVQTALQNAIKTAYSTLMTSSRDVADVRGGNASAEGINLNVHLHMHSVPSIDVADGGENAAKTVLLTQGQRQYSALKQSAMRYRDVQQLNVDNDGEGDSETVVILSDSDNDERDTLTSRDVIAADYHVNDKQCNDAPIKHTTSVKKHGGDLRCRYCRKVIRYSSYNLRVHEKACDKRTKKYGITSGKPSRVKKVKSVFRCRYCRKNIKYSSYHLYVHEKACAKNTKSHEATREDCAKKVKEHDVTYAGCAKRGKRHDVTSEEPGVKTDEGFSTTAETSASQRQSVKGTCPVTATTGSLQGHAADDAKLACKLCETAVSFSRAENLAAHLLKRHGVADSDQWFVTEATALNEAVPGVSTDVVDDAPGGDVTNLDEQKSDIICTSNGKMASQDPQRPHSIRNRYECGACLKRFSTIQAMKAHVPRCDITMLRSRKGHNRRLRHLRKLICLQCWKVFSNFTLLKQHDAERCTKSRDRQQPISTAHHQPKTKPPGVAAAGTKPPQSSMKKPLTTQSSVEKPKTTPSSVENPVTSQSSVDKRVTSQSSVKKRVTSQSSVEKRVTTQSSDEKPVTSQSSVEKRVTAQSSVEKRVTAQSRHEFDQYIEACRSGWKCTRCGYISCLRVELKRHLLLRHVNTIQCTTCSDRFTLFSAFQRHTQLVHDCVTSLECKYCGLACETVHDQQVHRNRWHSDKKFQCLDCLKRFSYVGDLKKHLRWTHVVPSATNRHSKRLVTSSLAAASTQLQQHITRIAVGE